MCVCVCWVSKGVVCTVSFEIGLRLRIQSLPLRSSLWLVIYMCNLQHACRMSTLCLPLNIPPCCYIERFCVGCRVTCRAPPQRTPAAHARAWNFCLASLLSPGTTIALTRIAAVSCVHNHGQGMRGGSLTLSLSLFLSPNPIPSPDPHTTPHTQCCTDRSALQIDYQQPVAGTCSTAAGRGRTETGHALGKHRARALWQI